jgi:predicted CxxxxCH...CXXCH cytochrome family protein
MTELELAAARSRRARLVFGSSGLLAVASLTLAVSCLDRRAERVDDANETRCATCHGDPARGGDFLLRAAPPRDLSGASSPGYPGVGAHARHLYAASTHGALACGECHVVPERVDSPGHADDERPAELVFGALARSGGRTPSYDPVARTCADGWCHREHADAVWTEPRPSEATCGTCHGLPPALPHPQSERCEACHGEVVDNQRHFVNAALHVDGIVQVQPGACGACHGSGEEPAPPRDTHGNASRASIGVGAHRVHLAGGAFGRPLECSECHRVPKTADEAGHAVGLPARVELAGIAASDGRSPRWDREKTSCSDTWCHGPQPGQREDSPSWIRAAPLGCTSCHGAPPPAPHPQLSNCSHCHAAVVATDDLTIIDRSRHVDGVVDVDLDPSCTSCHGAESAAPPRDTTGHEATTFAGVGAHQAHLSASAGARPVACSECHVVPEKPLSPGHIDTSLPAELTFAGVATAFGAKPEYAEGTCRQTACHGAVFPDGHRSGGSNVSPQWTKVDGSQAGCGSCHGQPPPRPHPLPTNCSECHEDVASDDVSFVHPELHVDGIVTFTVP